MKKQYIVSLALFIILAGIFISSITVAALDPLEQLEQDVDALAQDIAQAPLQKKCINMYGNRLQFWFRSSYTDIEFFILSDLETRVSRCYADRINHIDEILQKGVIDRFKTSALACNQVQYQGINDRISKIMDRRKKMFFLLNETQKYKKEYCEGDPGKYTFEESNKAIEHLKYNWRLIAQAISELRDEGSKNSLWKKKSWQIDQEKINERAKKRAQKFIYDFNEALNFNGLFKNKSNLKDDLKGLPEGKSRFNDPIKILTQAHRAQEAKKQQENIKNKYKEFRERERTTLLFLESERINSIENDFFQFEQTVLEHERKQEQYIEFDDALTTSILDSLIPFHQTTKDTSIHLKALQKALDAVLNRQNIPQGYRKG